MSFVSGLLGTAGGMNGTGISGPSGANILQPATQQMGTDALKQQQDLINAYQPGGTAALASQQDLLGQLGQQAQGLGPNPALAQLNQTTAANTANQAALMAGQRGSSQNTGMVARQAANVGAQNQQQAAGQAATMAAQQQIAARQQLAAQQAQMVGQQQAGQQQYTGNVLGAIQGQNNASVGMQSNINDINGRLAGQTMQGQNQMLGNMAGGLGTVMGLGGGGAAAGSAPYAGTITPGASGGLSNSAMQQLTTAGAALGGGAEGGRVEDFPKFMQGGQVNNLPISYNMMAQGGMPQEAQAGPRSKLGQHLAGLQQRLPIPQVMPTSMPMMAQGGKVPALVSPGEQYLPPQAVEKVKEGKNPLSVGERIPGKPKHKGNDYRNDTVKKNLDEGGIVIPNAVMQSKNPHWEAMKFVHATMAKNRKK